jgi:hypothetical protein
MGEHATALFMDGLTELDAPFVTQSGITGAREKIIQFHF